MSNAPPGEPPAPASPRAAATTGAAATPPAATAPAATAPASAWAPFRHRTFAIIWVATVVSNIGGWMYNVASGWLMTNLDADPLFVSLVQVANNLPMFLFAIPAGALVDIVDRRLFLIIAETAVAVMSTAFAVLVWLHLITPWSLLVLSFVVAVANAATAPAWQSVVPRLVPRSELPSAIAANSVGINVSRAVGPALGGLMVVAFGITAPFWVNAFSNVGVIAALVRWRSPQRSGPPVPPERFGQAMRSGLRHARHNVHLRSTLARTVAFFVFASAYWALLPLVAREHIGGSSALYGVLLGVIGASAVAGAFLLRTLRSRFGPDALLAGATVATAVATALFGAAHNEGVALAASVLAGASWIAGVSSLNVSAQVALPEWVRGRGLSMYVTIMFGSLSLGSAIWGEVASRAGLPLALFAAAAGGVLTIPLTWRWKLQTGAAIDFTPSMHWPEPVTIAEVEPDRGPVLTLVEYRIDPQHREAFLEAMGPYARVFRRNGAYDFAVFEDPAEEGRFVETFMTDSWSEHLRLHQRVTITDRKSEEAVRRWNIGAVKTTHLVLAQPRD
jgi:predicted MFS family arabinose efflux permease/quinol monooxygenase YgiN